MIINLGNENTFKNEIEKKRLNLVYFGAPWCGPCKKFAPIYENISNDFPSVGMFKINIEDDGLQNVTADYGIQSLPTIIAFYEGREIAREIGAPSDLVSTINDWLNHIESL